MVAELPGTAGTPASLLGGETATLGASAELLWESFLGGFNAEAAAQGKGSSAVVAAEAPQQKPEQPEETAESAAAPAAEVAPKAGKKGKKAAKQPAAEEDLDALLSEFGLEAKPEAKKYVLDEMVAEGKKMKLKTFELPQAVHLEGDINDLMQGFSVDNDLLTPTFKVKRPQMLKRYQAEIDAMCKDAEKYAEADRLARERVEAKNGLESYCHQIKNTLNEEQLKDKFTDDDKKVQEQILNDFDAGKTCVVKVLSACGIEKIVATKVTED